MATIGKLDVIHAASNTIPGKVVCTIDVRSDNPFELREGYDELMMTGYGICSRRNIDLKWKDVQQTEPVECDQFLFVTLCKSISDAGYQRQDLMSGAGHDGVALSSVMPISMLFVRCFEGISHHPAENVEAKDIAAAIEVSVNFIHQLINEYALIWKYQQSRALL
jgi:acetylornithine deacetylase/succinyl-diaminopimelate desuccinylase-like protein